MRWLWLAMTVWTSAAVWTRYERKASWYWISKARALLGQLMRQEMQQDGAVIPFPAGLKSDPRARPAYDVWHMNDESEYLYGDVMVTMTQLRKIIQESWRQIANKGRREKRKVGTSIYTLWPKDRPIAYSFHPQITAQTRRVIQEAIDLWQNNTCVRFQSTTPNRERIFCKYNASETNRLEFVDGRGCASYIGRVGTSVQTIDILQGVCSTVGIVSHEIGHALGFLHEHASPKRNDFIRINSENISPSIVDNFVRESDNNVLPSAAEVDYDFGSVMHYSSYALPLNDSLPTIVPKEGFENYQWTMGQRMRPSFIDYLQINVAYCNDACVGLPNRCANGGYPNPNDCRRCLCPSGLAGADCTAVEPSSNCPGAGVLTATADKQTLMTPNYPLDFESNTECIWLVRTRPGSKVHFELEGPLSLDCKMVCDENFLEIKSSANFRPTGIRLCCSEKQFSGVQTSDSHQMLFIMRNNGKRNSGFRIRVWTDAEASPLPELPPQSGAVAMGPVPVTSGSLPVTSLPPPEELCPFGFAGRHCRTRSTCNWFAERLGSPACHNGGKCVDLEDMKIGFTCICAVGFTGQQCERASTDCTCC